MESKTKRVEAVLFAAGKEVSKERISSLCSLPLEEVEPIVAALIEEYAQRDHSLQIIKKELGWKLTVRDEYVPLVSSIVHSTELDRPLMETLAIIAWKYPIVQSDVVKLRGAGAYEHMRLLEEQGFIAKEKSGRTFKVKLTPKFFEYFDLPSAEAKQAFLNQVPAEVLVEAERVEKEIEETVKAEEALEEHKQAEKEIREAMADTKN
ncbi:SMC-Scp complex subunit ScpB [Candidatus Woesearchaeota archaeon]|nr:SMC-Scp complex subunit ScpB [Candidatus Woesearchaeota archaeon]